MPARQQLTTTLSGRGQVVLPKAVREALGWESGTRRIVENTAEGVLLKPEPVFPVTRPANAFGCLAFRGAPKALEEMEAGVLAEAKRRHAGD